MTLLAGVLIAVALAVAGGGRSGRARLHPRRRRGAAAPPSRRVRRPRRRARGEVGRELPLAIDLLAGCLAVGAPMPVALCAAAEAAPGAASVLRAVAAELDAAGDAAAAWAPLLPGDATVDGGLAEVARTCARAGVSGAAIADELRRVARRLRARRSIAARGRVQRASVWVVAPLGLCFLPAFVLVGIVPLVAASVPQLLR